MPSLFKPRKMKVIIEIFCSTEFAFKEEIKRICKNYDKDPVGVNFRLSDIGKAHLKGSKREISSRSFIEYDHTIYVEDKK